MDDFRVYRLDKNVRGALWEFYAPAATLRDAIEIANDVPERYRTRIIDTRIHKTVWEQGRAVTPTRTNSRRNKVRRTKSRRNSPTKTCAMCPGELPPSNTTGVCSTCRETLRRRVDGSDVVRARQLRRKATARNNPPRMIGYTAKLFYERTVGRVPGYYKHEFTTPAEVIVNPTARDLKPGCVLLRPEDE
jgi:hypothetical protein